MGPQAGPSLLPFFLRHLQICADKYVWSNLGERVRMRATVRERQREWPGPHREKGPTERDRGRGHTERGARSHTEREGHH